MHFVTRDDERTDTSGEATGSDLMRGLIPLLVIVKVDNRVAAGVRL